METAPRFAAAGSDHPDVRVAAAEVLGALYEQLTIAPLVAMVALTGRVGERRRAVEQLLSATLQADQLVVFDADSAYVGGQRLGPDAIAAWAVGDHPGIEAVPLATAINHRVRDGPVLALAPGPDAATSLAGRWGGETALVAGATTETGDGRFSIDQRSVGSGVALVTTAETTSHTAVVTSQGVAPFGPTLAVTDADDRGVRSLGGRAAADVLAEILEPLPVSRVALGVMVESAMERDRSPSALRLVGLLGATSRTRALATDRPVPTGSLVRFVIDHVDAAGSSLADDLTRIDADPSPAGVIALSDRRRSPLAAPGPESDGRTIGELLTPSALLGLQVPACYGPIGSPGAGPSPPEALHRGLALLAWL